MEQNEQLIRVGIILEELGKKVADMSNRIEEITNNHVMKTDSRLAVSEEKVKRLESIVYGTMAFCFAQLIAIIIMLVKK